ncbi:MAG: hypothetical protein M3478_00455, partial [Planctomycetota bacterium]|nr:hypothetical protein [Planctomycetota bacterium]
MIGATTTHVIQHSHSRMSVFNIPDALFIGAGLAVVVRAAALLIIWLRHRPRRPQGWVSSSA